MLVLLRASTVGKNKWDDFCFDIFLGFHSAQFSDKTKTTFTWMIYIRDICLPQGGGDLPTASGEPKKGPEANGLAKTKKYMVPFDYVL